MQIDENLCMKFPEVLKQKLLKREIELPDLVQIEYEPILTNRAVQRNEDDYSPITREDFKSYFELGKTPKKRPRGTSEDFLSDPHYYGVSSFMNKELVEMKMKFPNPKKKMASGYVHMEGGPQETKLENGHVCWWLYKEADVSGFKLEKE